MHARRRLKLVTKQGLTLIEVIVVIAVISVLTVLILSAVQSAREASRRLSCASNLKQLGLAISSYETLHKVYPQGTNGNMYSAQLMVLPFLEQTNLYSSFNFSAADMLGGFGRGKVNFTAGSAMLATFCCPSDPDSLTSPTTNYAWNGGLGNQDMLNDFVGTFSTKSTVKFRYIRTSDITDGLSHTVAAAEWKIGRIGSTDDSSIVFKIDAQQDERYELFVQRCQKATRQTAQFGAWKKNAFWSFGNYGETILNFNSPPNSLSCFYPASLSLGEWPASSYHSSGVNTLFHDNHVNFTGTSVNPKTWHSLSTKAGNDNL